MLSRKVIVITVGISILTVCIIARVARLKLGGDDLLHESRSHLSADERGKIRESARIEKPKSDLASTNAPAALNSQSLEDLTLHQPGGDQSEDKTRLALAAGVDIEDSQKFRSLLESSVKVEDYLGEKDRALMAMDLLDPLVQTLAFGSGAALKLAWSNYSLNNDLSEKLLGLRTNYPDRYEWKKVVPEKGTIIRIFDLAKAPAAVIGGHKDFYNEQRARLTKDKTTVPAVTIQYDVVGRNGHQITAEFVFAEHQTGTYEYLGTCYLADAIKSGQ